MKIKRFIGSTTQEAMNKVKVELGQDAIILHTRNIKKPGLFGIFKRNIVEVVAALEETSTQELKYRATQDKNSSKVNEHLEYEVKRIRTMVESVVNTLDSKKTDLPEELSKYVDYLYSNGVNQDVAFQILSKINEQINLSNKDSEQIQEIVSYSIKDYLGEPSPINYKGEQKIIFFIGPTGVGKTTTLAKLAAKFSLENNYSIGMITSDTYRIAAIEQLKVYAEIMNIPIKIVYEIKDIYKAMSNFRDKDIIFVDTAGRNHKNNEQMCEIKELIDSVNNKEIHLVLNATTDFKLIRHIIKKYDFIKELKIIFSKVDEAINLGNILNTKFYFNNDISYLTTGQNVPDDIEIPNIDKLSKLLIGESKNV